MSNKLSYKIDYSRSRIYFPNGRVRHYKDQAMAYQLWLRLPKSTRAAFRAAGDRTPVYSHDYVSARNPHRKKYTRKRTAKKYTRRRNPHAFEVWRKPTKGEIKFGYGALHRSTVTRATPPKNGQKFKINGHTYTYGSKRG